MSDRVPPASPWGDAALGAPSSRVTAPVEPAGTVRGVSARIEAEAAIGEAPESDTGLDDPYLPPRTRTYRMMRLVRGNRSAKRIRIGMRNGDGNSPKWPFVFDISDSLERGAGSTVPQSVTLNTNIGTWRIEGYGLDAPGGLFEMLFNEQVLEVLCYRPEVHDRLVLGQPYISDIVEIVPEEEIEQAARRAA